MSGGSAGGGQLQRVLGVRALAANAINMTVGAGIFVLPAVVAAQLGSSAVLAYLVCGAAMGLVLLCFAESGSRVHASGGACAYVEAAFGPCAGFLVSTLLWFGYGVVSIAAVANAIVGTLGAAFPLFAQPIPRALFLVTLFASVAVLNIRGVKQGARAVEVLTAIKLLPLLGIVVVGCFAIRPENLAITSLPTGSEFGAAALVLFFAFGGSESAVTPSGEIRQPARTIPRGLVLGVSGVVLLYLGLQVVAQGVLGSELAANPEAPLAAVAGSLIGEPGRIVLLAAAAISMLGTVTGDLLVSPRALYFSACDGVLPASLAAVHSRFNTPHRAIALYAVLAFGFAVSGAFAQLAVLSSVAILIVYLWTVLATMQLRRRDTRASKEVFRLFGGYTIPLLAAAMIVYLLAQATRAEWTAIGGLLALAALVYFLRRNSVGSASVSG